MDLHYRQEITVGTLVLTGVAAFILGTMWLSGKESASGNRIVNVAFDDVGNMKAGNPVKVSGVQLGKVREIAFRDVGDVRVTLSLDPRIQPRKDAKAELTSVGLVGDVMIDFDPGTSPEALGPDEVIKGTAERGLMDIGGELTGEAKATMASLREVANKDLADDLRKTLQSFQRLANTYNAPATELNATMIQLRQLSARVDSVLASTDLSRVVSNADSTSVRFGKLADQYTATGARLDTLLMKMNRGEGTLGKLMTDTSMYNQLTDLSRSLKEFLDDLKKHPGKIPVTVKIF
ncbi:MAG TPA: MlaD family protein [Gemmatimonadales bacterium]|nr:MlaD family protein [Gemmatimonadales bacterium]